MTDTRIRWHELTQEVTAEGRPFIVCSEVGCPGKGLVILAPTLGPALLSEYRLYQEVRTHIERVGPSDGR